MVDSHPNEPLLVVVPGEYPGLERVHRGSGMVARGVEDGDDVDVFFEGNLYDAQNIVTYADRVHHAAGRAVTNYPTTAKVRVPRDAVRVVGTYDYPARRITLAADPSTDLIARWLEIEPEAVPAELVVN